MSNRKGSIGKKGLAKGNTWDANAMSQQFSPGIKMQNSMMTQGGSTMASMN